ncbi:MAG: ABC transporter substrate-binding protein [Spirochaetales bacterium]|nr:ABC transporter substrate-binding protein [Spirochaetales bacterium]
MKTLAPIKRSLRILIPGLLIALALPCFFEPLQSQKRPQRIRLQLKWKHQFQFAGYYAALKNGYYKEAGLDVEIREARPGQEPMDEVLKGRADFGIGTTDVLLLRARREPVVALAVIFQHSPLALLARADRGIDSLHDLAGKRIMIEPHSAEIFAYLQEEGISSRHFELLEHTFTIDDLLQKKADAMSVYVTDEPYALRQAGLPYRIFTPRSAGIDFYGDNLFTTEEQIARYPGRVRDFLKASLKGWEYARKNPEEIVQLIYNEYSQRHSLEHLRFEARQTLSLMPELVEIGHMNPGRWQRIVEVYTQQNMLPADFDLNGFLYRTDQAPDLTWLFILFAAVSALALIAAGVATHVIRLNRALILSHQKLEHMAHHDALTGLPNRVLFFSRLNKAIAEPETEQLVLLDLDLDEFKPVNDTFGHLVGDRALQAVAHRFRASLQSRWPDALLARTGGDEFSLVARVQDPVEAAQMAQSLLDAVSTPISIREHSCQLGASIGIALHRAGETLEDFLRRADSAMYRSKARGKSCYSFAD